jgi:hypothetical protein
MTEDETRAVERDAGLEQRIGNAGNGFHGADAGSDVGGGDALGAEVAKLAELNQVLKAVVGCGDDESCSLPRAELPGGDTQYAKNILAAVSVHCQGR